MPIDIVNVGKNAMDVRKSVALTPYSKIIINVAKGNNSDEVISFIAGDDTGTTLEFDCPWGTQQMAEDLLAKMNGYQYQPYEATGAITNPAVEMGDAVQVNGIYGGVYTQDSLFTHTFYSDFSAPQDEQLDHEFTYESPIERRLTRQEAYSKATFKIQHEDIEAKVSKEGGYQESESFSWKLLSDKFQLYAGTKAVFTCNKGGVEVDGTIKARDGFIGTTSTTSGGAIVENGFHIGRPSGKSYDAIWHTKTAYNDNNNGIYLGTNGVGLGQGKFYVTSEGALTATSATITGTIRAKDGRIGATSDDGTSGGFFLTGNKFYTDGKTSYNSNVDGVYVGTDGIGLGQAKFYVTSEGKLTATDVDITGEVEATSGKFHGDIQCASITFDSGVTINGSNITDSTITGGKIGSGEIAETNIADSAVSDDKISGVSGTKVGSGINGNNLNSKSVPKSKTTTEVQTSLDNGDSAYASVASLTGGTIQASWLGAQSINANTITANQKITVASYAYQSSIAYVSLGDTSSNGKVTIKGHQVSYHDVKDTSNNTIHVIGYS